MFAGVVLPVIAIVIPLIEKEPVGVIKFAKLALVAVTEAVVANLLPVTRILLLGLKSIILPLFCPCCTNLMKNRYDKQFYIQYNRCFNCQIDFETNIRKLGLWEEYEKNIINSDIEHTIKDYTEWIDEIINNDTNDSFVTEAGDIENWVGSSKKKLLENKEETIKYLQNLKKTSNLT